MDYFAIIRMIKCVTKLMTQIFTIYALNAVAKGKKTINKLNKILQTIRTLSCVLFIRA